MIYIGIDPGKCGSYADIRDGVAYAYPWDDALFIEHMRSLVASGDSLIAAVEKVGAMPHQGLSSTFSFGKSAGYIEGVLASLAIPYQLVSPRKWKVSYGLDNDKAKSIAVCRKLFPDMNLRRTEKCRTDSADMAEATLLALYAKRNF